MISSKYSTPAIHQSTLPAGQFNMPAPSTSWQVTNLTSATLLPGHYYLIQESSGGMSGVSLPIADATGAIAMAATAGKVALINNTTSLTGTGCPLGPNVIDFVGYGPTANCFEG